MKVWLGLSRRPTVKAVDVEPIVVGENLTRRFSTDPATSEIGEEIGFTEKRPGATEAEVTVTAVVALSVIVELCFTLTVEGATASELATSGAGAAMPKPKTVPSPEPT